MQIENHGVLELAPVKKNLKPIYKVMSNCQFSIKLGQMLIAYTDGVR